MLSAEYRAAVDSGDLLLAKIMMKDSFLLDPTGALLDEMLCYAQQKHPEIMEAYDGGALEDDSEKWNKDVMNLELVELIGNFSKRRVDHLRCVVKKVLAAQTIAVQKKNQLQSVSENKTFHPNTVQSKKAEVHCEELAAIAKLAETIVRKAKKAQECQFPSDADKCVDEIKEIIPLIKRRINNYEKKH